MKFNIFKKRKAITLNYEGARAYKITPAFELYSAAVTSGLNPTSYEDGDARLERIKTLIAKCDPIFVAKLAIYVRTKMHLRTMPIVLIVELAKNHSGDHLISKATYKIIQRADEITELLAYFQKSNGRWKTKKLNRLSKQLQKGIAMAFNKFDEYQFAKYNRKTVVSLKDALFLSHPSPKNENQQLLFNKLINGTLETPYTWETELSALGQEKFKTAVHKEKAFTKKWEALIDSGKLGYMALLRNLRNISEANVSGKHMEKVCATISDKTRVSKSKQLPFRFLSAYRELKGLEGGFTSSILEALEKAVLFSSENIKGFGFETSVVIACDVSGSMQKSISPRSKVLLYDIGLILGMLMQSRCQNVISGMFGDSWKVINMPKHSILSNVDEYYRREGEVGYSTNGYKVIKNLITQRKVMDKIMIFTDTQMWNSAGGHAQFDSTWKQYKATIAPTAKLYLFDLAGYGNMPIDIKQNDVYLIAGWSDKIFDILYALQKGSDAVKVIKAMKLD